jgi:hypothetical protein
VSAYFSYQCNFAISDSEFYECTDVATVLSMDVNRTAARGAAVSAWKWLQRKIGWRMERRNENRKIVE